MALRCIGLFNASVTDTHFDRKNEFLVEAAILTKYSACIPSSCEKFYQNFGIKFQNTLLIARAFTSNYNCVAVLLQGRSDFFLFM